MLRTVLMYIGNGFAGVGSLPAAKLPPSSPDSPPTSPYRAVLDRYCVICHNENLKTADLMLDKMDVANVSESPETWEKVVWKLRARAMPPIGMPQPDNATYGAFATYLETERGPRPSPIPAGQPTIASTVPNTPT